VTRAEDREVAENAQQHSLHYLILFIEWMLKSHWSVEHTMERAVWRKMFMELKYMQTLGDQKYHLPEHRKWLVKYARILTMLCHRVRIIQLDISDDSNETIGDPEDSAWVEHVQQLALAKPRLTLKECEDLLLT
jgi:hypothetical protein